MRVGSASTGIEYAGHLRTGAIIIFLTNGGKEEVRDFDSCPLYIRWKRPCHRRCFKCLKAWEEKKVRKAICHCVEPKYKRKVCQLCGGAFVLKAVRANSR
jgi:hypothetical protein